MKMYPDVGCARAQIPVASVPSNSDQRRIRKALMRKSFVVKVEFEGGSSPELHIYFEHGLPDLAAGDLARKYVQEIAPALFA